MKKENKIVVCIIVLFSLIMVSYCICLVLNRDRKINDAIKFRNEYMELNDKMNDETDKVYTTVNISKTNTVKYLSDNEIIDLLENGIGLIYFGEATSSWCRSIITYLTEIAEEKKETIYYLDISKIRSLFEINNDKISKIKEGSKTYYKILSILDEYLEDYYLIDELGNRYNTNEKRLTLPTIIMVNDGEIVGFHEGTVSTQESGSDKLNSEEIEELKEIITQIINSKKTNDVCTMEKC